MCTLSSTSCGFFLDRSDNCLAVTASGPYMPTTSAPASFADQAEKTWATTVGALPSGQALLRSFCSLPYSVSNEVIHPAAVSSVPNILPSRVTSALALSASLSRLTSTSSASPPAASLGSCAYRSRGGCSTEAASATAVSSEGFGSWSGACCTDSGTRTVTSSAPAALANAT